MTNANNERNVGKKGFGTVMLNRLREVDYASTEELAALAGVTVKQAYSRLMFLQSQEKMVVSAGKGDAKVWSMADKAPPPAPTVESKGDSSVVGAFNRSHGWKPNLNRYKSVESNDEIKVGAKLLVEYPESWRHSALVSVTRAPDSKGVVQCWDLRGKMYAYVPATPEAASKYGCKVVHVRNEKELMTLENE